ncbi:MAG: hypothetical protein AMJ73_03170 [candidate division Zixibacteria bacterium SM1_73]|nr:MAG: hypothetical protein AMJ73_03170 [candidate division Zixibacteria bacterium SM1_73]
MNANKSSRKKRSCFELAPLEKKALSSIFKTILEFGRAPTVEELELSMKESGSRVITILDELEEKDLLLRRKGTQQVVSIYPFSLTSTKHQIVLEDGKALFAMCAVDALGMPNMFNKNVEVISQCEWCKQEITIEIKNGEVTTRSHPHIQIWNLERQEGPSAETCCPVISFFCSDEHFREWQDKNSDLAKKGQNNALDQAYPDIRERWKRYGETVGVRGKKS